MGSKFGDSQIFQYIFMSFLVKSKKASNLWADTDEEDNADNDTGDTKNPEEVQDQQKNFTILAIESHIYEDPGNAFNFCAESQNKHVLKCC